MIMKIIMRGRLDLVLIEIRMLMGLLERGRKGWRWMIVGRGDGWFLNENRPSHAIWRLLKRLI